MIVTHETIMHARCPFVEDMWDYYDVAIETDQLFDIIPITKQIDQLRGNTLSQEDITETIACHLPKGARVTTSGKHTRLSSTTVTVEGKK